MKKLLALCLAVVVFSGSSCKATPNTMLTCLSSRYETMKAKILPIEDNKEYAKKTQERWNNSQNAKTADICIWVDENDDNVLHVRYKGEECKLNYSELSNKQNSDGREFLDGNVYASKLKDDDWIEVRISPNPNKHDDCRILWHKGAVIIEEVVYPEKDQTLAILAENVYINAAFLVGLKKVTIAARNELWFLRSNNSFNPDKMNLCELISYRLYNFDNIGIYYSKRGMDEFFQKFYKKIAQPQDLMNKGFFSCYGICIKNPVTIKDLPVSLYRTAEFSELNQIEDKEKGTNSIRIAQSNATDDLVNCWLQYFDPQNKELNVKIKKLTGTTNVSYKFSDDRIDLPEIENCIKSDIEKDCALSKNDVQRQVHEEACNYLNFISNWKNTGKPYNSLSLARNKNGDIDIIPPSGDSVTEFNNGFKIKKGYKTRIKCNNKIIDVEFDLLTTQGIDGSSFGKSHPIYVSNCVFYLKPEGNGIRRPFSYDVDNALNHRLKTYIEKKNEKESNKLSDIISFEGKVDFFNKHGHAPK